MSENMIGTKTRSNLLGLLVFAGLTTAAALAGRASRPGIWYRRLRKPPLQPPPWIFGPVWSFLYATIAYSGYRVWASQPSAARTRALVLWTAQLGLNASWSPVFFLAHKPKAALGIVSAMIPTIAAYATCAGRVDGWAGGLVIPYLGWTSFATYLNAGIVQRNKWLFAQRNATVVLGNSVLS